MVPGMCTPIYGLHTSTTGITLRVGSHHPKCASSTKAEEKQDLGLHAIGITRYGPAAYVGPADSLDGAARGWIARSEGVR